MKIIQIMPEFGLGGAEIMCENLVYGLKKSGNTIIVVSLFRYCSAITDRMENAGIDVRYFGKKPGIDCTMIPKLFRLFRVEKPDVVHTHRHCLQYVVPAAVLAGIRCRVHTVHSIASKENNRLGRMLNKVFFRWFGVVPVGLSDQVQKTIVEEYGLSKERVPVVFNGIDLSRCNAKKNYGRNGKFKILHIGRFVEAKNHKGLLEAFLMFYRNHPDSVLYLIGDGQKREEIESYIKENGLNGAVVLLGLQDNVYDYLHGADIFTLPSLYEGVPMTLVEAMGTGLPIVATMVGGVPDMLDNTCSILTEISSYDINEAFERYYLDEKLRATHGKRAKQVAERFSSEVMTRGYLKVYVRGA